ncbi:hypothetical protein J5Y03_08050 [Bacillus sp. RG28]|uniref:Lipoprotein n=1 Tax=Gottfriedia endophytica TaxID=2820819 RepID=A0A940NN12_9BACI|nr:hypothetical protein [Gottfriedia endophytica]MBP0725144.1 hypothetical protein [Gottfriedia endophytica]
MKRLAIIILCMFMVSACGKKEVSVTKEKANKTQSISNEIKENKQMTRDINKEKGVIAGKAYVQGEMAIGTLVLKKGVSDKEAKILSEKYFNQLKREYKGKKINVQAVRDGKNIVSLNNN